VFQPRSILITGNMGYVGPVVARHLRAVYPAARIIGFDSGYFAHCLTAVRMLPERVLDEQVFGDLRSPPADLLDGVDSVVHLAAISNDPMGNKFESVTDAINKDAGARFAQLAISSGVVRFVFASSCSVYGFSDGGPRCESDALNPLTAYARSKVHTENCLSSLASSSAVTTALRFSTACGMSDRLRLDLVLNDFVAAAMSTGKITVLSDGSPWRPLIDVTDMARAIEWGLSREAAQGGEYLAINIGRDDWNFQVRDLAKAVADALPGTAVSINPDAPPDKRSYRVDFSRFRSLAPGHQPLKNIQDTIGELVAGLKVINFSNPDFRTSELMRLCVLEHHIEQGRLDRTLQWVG